MYKGHTENKLFCSDFLAFIFFIQTTTRPSVKNLKWKDLFHIAIRSKSHYQLF